MKTVKDVIRGDSVTDTLLHSTYRGSKSTYENVKEQIRVRFGSKCSKEFDPYKDAMTFATWLSQGYVVKKGEKCLKSITFLEVKDENTGKVLRKIKRSVNLFHRCQVERL